MPPDDMAQDQPLLITQDPNDLAQNDAFSQALEFDEEAKDDLMATDVYQPSHREQVALKPYLLDLLKT